MNTLQITPRKRKKTDRLKSITRWMTAGALALMLTLPITGAQSLQAAENNADKAAMQSDQDTKTTKTTTSDQTSDKKMAAKDNRHLQGQRGFVGKEIRNQNNEEIGEVENVLVNQDGTKIEAIVSVGGFWGIGDKKLLWIFAIRNWILHIVFLYTI